MFIINILNIKMYPRFINNDMCNMMSHNDVIYEVIMYKHGTRARLHIITSYMT